MTITVPHGRPALAPRGALHIRNAEGHTVMFWHDARCLPVHFVAPPAQAGARCYIVEPLSAAERTLS